MKLATMSFCRALVAVAICASCGGDQGAASNSDGQGGGGNGSGGQIATGGKSQTGDGGAGNAAGATNAGSGGAAGAAAGSAGHAGAAGGSTGGAAAGTSGNAGAAGAVAQTGGASGSAPPKVFAKPLFSADFENGVVGQGPPAPFTAGISTIVDNTKSYSGSKSIKVFCHDGADGCPFGLKDVRKYISASGKTVYTRVMLWLSNFPQAGDGSGHWDFIREIGDITSDDNSVKLDDGAFLAFGGFTNGSAHKLHMFGTLNFYPKQDCVKQATMMVKPQTWACIEMKTDENDILNYGVSVDGKEIANYSFPYQDASSECVPTANIFQGVWYLPVITSMEFGFKGVNNNPGDLTVWIDDVAISSQPIGCPPAPASAK